MDKIKANLASADLILWKWTPNEKGESPIKLRVTYREKRKLYPVSHDGKKLFLRESEWNDIQDASKKLRGERANIRDTVTALLVQAKGAISRTTKGNRPFTWEKFEGEFLLDESDKGFLSMFSDHLEGLRNEGRIGTYKSYNNALQAFKAFRKSKELSPYDITPKLLKDFETFLVEAPRSCGKTTVGMYVRALKVVYNLAADSDPVLLESYPFARKQTDRNRYKIKTGSGHKGDALTVEQLQAFIGIKVDPLLPTHEEARLLWLFSFHCQGMNMKDICLLKYKDIQGELIRYVRAKTKDTEAKESIMEIPLTDSIREIIRVIGNPDKRPGSYVFPIIPNGLASTVKKRVDREKTQNERIDEIVRQKIKMVNDRLKAICKDENARRKQLKLSKEDTLPEITTYWARHSYAQLLKASGESVELIRELLGHSDIRTTEAYLKRFDLERKKKVSDKIGDLLKVS